MRRSLIAAALLAACGGAECPQVDEAALRAQIRAEVREELQAQMRQENAAQLTREARELELPGERFRIATAAAPARGAEDPLVTIVVFTDFQCPFCRRAVPTIDQIVAAHPEEVQVVFRNNPLPFHRHAMPAAELALEAYDQGGSPMFWRLHDLLFENQRALHRAHLETLGQRVGMDLERLRIALDEHTHRARIRADQEAAQGVGARGTPSFFVNGILVTGAQPFERFEEIITEELALARRLLAAGVPREQLYARFLRDAREDAPEPPSRPPTTRRRQPDPSTVYRVPIDGRPQLGLANALVTIVEVADFQCPFCARVQPTLEQLRQRYGNDVRLVFRHNPLPFHQRAMPAAEAAEEVRAQLGDEAFFRYGALLFENQRSLTRENLLAFATQVGANRQRVRRALDDHRHRPRIEEDQRLVASLGARGTPSFFINGRNLRGAQPEDAFRRVIDEEVNRARDRLAQGTPRADLYEATIANGATSPQPVAP